MKIAIVIPLRNEEGCVPELLRRLKGVLEHVPWEWEILLVDDASCDRTWSCIRSFHREDPRVKGIRFAQPAGHEVAMFAGLEWACGDGVLTMDGDLQHPPEKIPDFVESWQDGLDLIYGFKTDQLGRSWFKMSLNRLFHLLFSLRTGISLHPETSNFQILGRRLVDQIVASWEPSIFLRGWFHRHAKKKKEIPFRADRRFWGRTKQNIPRLIAVGIRSLLFFPSNSKRSFGTGCLVPGSTTFYALSETLGLRPEDSCQPNAVYPPK